MAYDEALAARIREELSPLRDVAEIKMFGGLCFTLKGNMVAGVVNDELMVRFDPAQNDRFLAEPGARPMDFTKRPMNGFGFIGAQAIRTKPALRKWLKRCLDHVEPMPPKKPKKKAAPRAPGARKTARR